METQERKLKHINVCLDYPVEYTTKTAGFEDVPWAYTALPEFALEDIDLRTMFLGKQLRAPLLIGAMTGGAEFARKINRNLAQAAQQLGLGMMLGSQRVMLEHLDAQESFMVRDLAPDILLIGNLGVAQLNKGYGQEQLVAAVERVGADALALHANPLQEALQSGDTDFTQIIPKLEHIVPRLPFATLLKEVGHGLSIRVARAVSRVGFAALDVAGAGGTSWAKVESFVRFGELRHADLVEVGIPTVQALCEVRSALPEMPLIASGGIRSGLDIAKALSLGASVVAIARPLLRPALEGVEAVTTYLEERIWELRVALFAAGIRRLADLADPSIDG